ncbi:hypothetical protein CERSUDRAFT_127779 [Gelatoporia subvermispora B]|uniref:Citrate transporter-like domain-containing protein n=1 Tax=Ceriporiopsis subvermispora (strain B) TaxID=914234 RepID=M2P5R2_CERS8|nr:hypothetical protein CERSUDRAFT_127779 [Gelatoporia subvermispora B]
MGEDIGNWSAILTLVLFLLSNTAVVLPARIPIPRPVLKVLADICVYTRILPPSGSPLRRAHVDLNFITVPLLSVLVLLVSGAINATVVRNGIVGADGVQPLDIMALFMSLAYLSISLDATGLLRFLAFWVARTGGSSGQRLYAYFYAFFLLCGVIVENDPVILSGTVFLAYFTRVSGITPPTAWIFAQFAAASPDPVPGPEQTRKAADHWIALPAYPDTATGGGRSSSSFPDPRLPASLIPDPLLGSRLPVALPPAPVDAGALCFDNGHW